MSNQQVIDLLSPVLSRLKTMVLVNPVAVEDALNAEFPAGCALLTDLAKLGNAGLVQGWLCTKEAGGTRFSRVAKPEAAQGFSIDAVLLSGDGPWHKHTKGEINCLLPLEGQPKFCGMDPPWAAFEPGSQHVPSVTGGKMLIFYLLPDGAVEWTRAK
jgi:hypothetical protein